MRTLYLFYWNRRMYVCTNGMEMARFADWLTRERGEYPPVAVTSKRSDMYVPNVEKYG